jgi:Zn-dependent metalloprotease
LKTVFALENSSLLSYGRFVSNVTALAAMQRGLARDRFDMRVQHSRVRTQEGGAMRKRASFCCYIVPPHVLDHLAQTGDAAQQQRARRAIAITEQARGQRAAIGAMLLGGVSSGTKRRTVYDAQHSKKLPGKLMRSEDGAASKDSAAEQAFAGCGDTYDFYQQILHRNSIDDRGMRLDSTVHYDRDYDNAFWNGQQMVYGDGDGVIFTNFTACLDVIGHELTHGVTASTANLDYQDQPGALNESMSDVFGTLVKQWKLGQTVDKADWLIGAGLLAPGIKGKALRSMKEPGTAYDDPKLGKDPQPAKMKDYVQGDDDNGGVHINSGIPNYAFYLAASAIGGRAWEKAGLIWYDALTKFLKHDSDFQAGANATFTAAGLRFGSGSLEAQAVRNAWNTVGLQVTTPAIT